MGLAQASATLELRLLGPPQIEREGAPVNLDTRKAVALLAYLAVTGRVHAREALATFFWPEYRPERAYANLRRTLWALNKALGKEWFDADEEAIGLVRGPGLWLDVETFQGHLETCRAHGHDESHVCPTCLAPLSAAVALYRDDFLAGFTLRDSPAFDDWQFFQAEELRQELASALERLVGCYTVERELEPAIACARRWLALDTLQEAAHRALMRLYTWSGQRAAALRQYQECVRILQAEVGVQPEQETTDLYEAIRSGQLPPLPQAGPAPIPSPVPVGRPAEVPHNLPPQPTAFVGRRDELAEIAGLLQRPACRLLTLVGPGGIGKTRLALQAAADRLAADPGAHAHGIYAVSLAPLDTARGLVPAIADAAGFSFFQQEREDPKQQLLNFLCEKRMLLLLDNFEHLMDGAELVAELLEAAPGVKVLVTSRERLNLRGEWVLEVGGMRFPVRREVEVEPLESYSAIQLFLQRAGQVDVGFSPSRDEWANLVRICQLVEGMPLGIELAAAWIRVFSCREIADQIAGEIERNLDFLTTSMRDVPERHRNMRAVFDHSWGLLSEEEADALRKLSVFRGGFSIEAAREVAGAGLPILSALVDKSLLRRLSSGRYGFHELLRQYAKEKLDGVPLEQVAVRDRHASYFATFLQQWEEHLRGANQMQALEKIREEIENVQSAWRWAADQGRAEEIGRAAGSLYRYYEMRSRFREGEAAFGQAVAGLQAAAGRVPARGETVGTELGLVMVVQGYFASRLYEDQEAGELLRGGLTLLRHVGARKELALANILFAWSRQASVLYAEQRVGYADAEALAQESLAIYEELGDQAGAAIALLNLGLAASTYRGDRLEAARLIRRSADINRQIGNHWGAGIALFELGEIAQRLGARLEAKRTYQESLEMRRQIDDRWGVALCLDYVGYLARELGEYEDAERLHQESLALHREIGDRLGIAGSLDNLGLVYFDRGAHDKARDVFWEGLAIRQDVGRRWDIAISLQHMGDVALALGDLEAAASWYQEGIQLYEGLKSAGMALAHCGLGEIYRTRGDTQRARAAYRVALGIALQVSQKPQILDILAGMAHLLADSGEEGRAARLAALVALHEGSSLQTRQRAERLLAVLSSRVSPEEIATLQEEARSAEPEIVAAQVLEAL